jgi:hypothetical protein
LDVVGNVRVVGNAAVSGDLSVNTLGATGNIESAAYVTGMRIYGIGTAISGIFVGRVRIGPGGASPDPAYTLDVRGDIRTTGRYRRGNDEGVDSATCPAGQTFSGLTVSGGIITSAGSCTPIGGGGGYTTIQDEGTSLPQRSTLNFTGAGVTCSDDGTKTNCNIPGGGISWPLLAPDGSAGAPSYSFTNNSNMGMFRAGANILAFSTAGTERLRIDGNGNVGIGTSPSYKLEVAGDIVSSAASSVIWSKRPTGSGSLGAIYMGASDSLAAIAGKYDQLNFWLYNGSSWKLPMSLNTNFGVPLDSSHHLNLGGGLYVRGNVRIGSLNCTTYANGGKLTTDASGNVTCADDIGGGGGISWPLLAPDGTAAAPSYSFANNSNMGMFRAGANILAFSTAGTERLRIDGNGNVGIGTSPSYKLDVSGDTRITGNLSIGGNVIMGWERIANSCSSCNSMTLTCSAGKKVLGGGCGIIGITTYRLKFSGPISDNQWQCNTDDVVPTLQGFIICARVQ